VPASDGRATVFTGERSDEFEAEAGLPLIAPAPGRFTAARTTGSLEPEPTGLRADLARLRHLARGAKASAGVVDRLASS
jgi:hypothetical protein